MFKINLVVLVIMFNVTTSFSQDKYEKFSFKGLTGIVEKQSLEIIVNTIYTGASISYTDEITLFLNDTILMYNPVTKTVEKICFGGSNTSVYLGLPNVPFSISKETSFFLLKDYQNEKYIGVCIPDSLAVVPQMETLDLHKDGNPYLAVGYEINEDISKLYLPEVLRNELGIKTYSFNKEYAQKYFNKLLYSSAEETALTLKNESIPLTLLYLSLSKPEGPYENEVRVKDNMIEQAVLYGYYNGAVNLYNAFSISNENSFWEDTNHYLLQEAISKKDLSFIKSLPPARLKSIRIEKENSTMNLLFYALMSQDLPVIDYFLSIGLDANVINVKGSGENVTALNLIATENFDESRKAIEKLLKTYNLNK